MPITRTPIIDDDGSMTVGTVFENAWKQELYNQIDAFVAAASTPVIAGFTFTDGSGAGLVFTTQTNFYAKVGRIVLVICQVIYPATANGAAAKLAGLPFRIEQGHAGFYQGYGVPHFRAWGIAGTSVIELLNPTSGAALTNANMSGANVTLHGFYLTA